MSAVTIGAMMPSAADVERHDAERGVRDPQRGARHAAGAVDEQAPLIPCVPDGPVYVATAVSA